MKESEIQKNICDYLQMRGYFFTRTNNMPVFDAKQGRYRAFPKYTLKGMPDILLLLKGKLIGIEVKSETGRQSVEQKAFESLMVENGGAYILARSVNDIMGWGL